MASTYSPSLRLELIGDGDQSGIWGQTTNNNLGYLLEQAVSGVVTIAMTDANYTMSNFNGVVDEARNQVLIVTGTLTATRNLIAPLVEKTYVVQNNTTGSQSVQIIGSSGLGVTIPNGIAAYVYCDGTNFYNAISGSVGNYKVNGNLTVTGTLGVTGATSLTTGSISGIMTAPTATAGTNTTQIATTAFALANGIPSGAIVLWSGSIASIPTGWLLCNGSSGTPDLRDRFIVGAGSTYAVAATGGTADAVVVSHTHTASSAVADPTHTHGGVIGQTSVGGAGTGNQLAGNGVISIPAASTGITVTTTVASAGVSGINQNLPPYYALAYIMKG
jgi:hypothetical protein